MLISLKWLRDYVAIPKTISPEKLAQKLTTHTVEIDSVESQAEKYRGVVVAKVLKVEAHPNADRLRVCEVDFGTGARTIVCGAPNVEAGQMVPVATIGAILPNNLEIKSASLRGVESEGMICAEDELGLGDNHVGIMVLAKRAKIGQEFSEYLGVDDSIIEVDNKSITNRPDLWGHLGIAREISAFLELKLNEPKKIDLTIGDAKRKLDIEVEEKDLCPRYMALIMGGVEVKESPQWIQERLMAVGMRPINNVVDATNYVMLELGQPMHAFDAEKIDKIIIRLAKNGEKIETLDRKTRELSSDMLVIADSRSAIAVAGVIGGANSEISDETSSVILEIANFEAISIRKTSQKLALRTESSMRFEKSLDPLMCELALARVFEILSESCPKLQIEGPVVDIDNSKKMIEPIEIDLEWLGARIGESITQKKVENILARLGFEFSHDKTNPRKKKVLTVTPPSWRAGKDIRIPEDVVEEISRIFGYDNIGALMPSVLMARPHIEPALILEREIKDILALEHSLYEVYNHSFVSEEFVTKLGVDTGKYLRILNPISGQHGLLRQSLIPNMLENIRANQRQTDYFGLFELGSVYFDIPGDIEAKPDKEKLPHQEKRIGITLVAEKNEELLDELKGIVEGLIARISGFDVLVNYEEMEIIPAWARKESTALVVSELSGEKSIGIVSLLDKKLLASCAIKKSVAICELNLASFLGLSIFRKARKYSEINKYPSVIRDLAFIVDSKILFSKLRTEILGAGNIVKSVELFDVYSDEKLGVAKKNLAFHIVYQSPERTLTSEEVDDLQKEIIKNLEEKFGAVIRNF